MMRWKYIELSKGEYPPQIAKKYGNGWVILQQEVPKKIEVRHVSGQFSHWIDGFIWEDVPLHIESKE
jgi:hypothetical protein